MIRIIDISELVKSYGKTTVLKGVNLSFGESKITVILGPNGSGKTTLIKSILGLVIPDSGEIRVLNKPIEREWKYRSQISYMPQIANFPANLKVVELIRMVEDLRGISAEKDKLMADFGLHPFLNKKLSHLSGGTRQKVNILLAFMYDNPIMVLDEPTSGLDPVALIRLKDLILQKRDQGKSFIISTHIMRLVEELGDEIVFLLEGEIYFKGSVKMLKEKLNEQDIEKAIARILVENDNQY